MRSNYMNRISQKDRFIGLDKIDKYIETIDSLHDLAVLYEKEVQNKLDTITMDPILQDQIKDALGFN